MNSVQTLSNRTIIWYTAVELVEFTVLLHGHAIMRRDWTFTQPKCRIDGNLNSTKVGNNISCVQRSNASIPEIPAIKYTELSLIELPTIYPSFPIPLYFVPRCSFEIFTSPSNLASDVLEGSLVLNNNIFSNPLDL